MTTWRVCARYPLYEVSSGMSVRHRRTGTLQPHKIDKAGVARVELKSPRHRSGWRQVRVEELWASEFDGEVAPPASNKTNTT